MYTKLKDYILACVILITFLTYYLDLLKDGMVMSGIIAVIILAYISMLWAENISDERDEFIRSKVDRLMYILTLVMILADITYKTFTHQSYMSAVVILTVLSLSKIILTKVVKESH